MRSPSPHEVAALFLNSRGQRRGGDIVRELQRLERRDQPAAGITLDGASRLLFRTAATVHLLSGLRYRAGAAPSRPIETAHGLFEQEQAMRILDLVVGPQVPTPAACGGGQTDRRPEALRRSVRRSDDGRQVRDAHWGHFTRHTRTVVT